MKRKHKAGIGCGAFAAGNLFTYAQFGVTIIDLFSRVSN